jgi:4-hydroxy-3-methylbut-2-enyl diphosphate reductase
LLRIKVAKDIGFCFGVDKAVEIAKKLLEKGGNVYVTGELIHNEEEMKKLNQLGLKTFDVTSKWPDLSEATVLIRAHGVPVDQLEKIKAHAKKVVDATCPVVLSLSESILDAKKQGFEVLLYGHDKHDEVVFLKSVVNDLKVFDSPESLRYSTKKIALFSQTTMDADGFKEISKAIVENIEDLSSVMIKNSICNVTYQREREVKVLASENDVCLVIGGSKSSNTRKLFNIAKSINYKTYLVLNMADLKPEWFDAAESVGICSGTSTSMGIVDEIVERLRTFKN